MWRFARLPSEKWTERRTDTGGDRLRHLDQTLANIGKHWPIRRQDSGNGCEFVGLGGGWVERGGWMKGIRDKMFDIGGPYREDARCFRAEAISSCAVVLTLTAAETRLTERSSVWRRRGTVTYHLENRGGGTATSPFNYFFLCFIIAACWWLESGVQPIDRASLVFLLASPFVFSTFRSVHYLI